MSQNKDAGLLIGDAVLLVAFAISLTFYRLFLFTKLWSYIAVPMGAHPITMWQSLGVSTLIGFIMLDETINAAKNKDQSGYAKIGTNFLTSTMGFGIAYWIFA